MKSLTIILTTLIIFFSTSCKKDTSVEPNEDQLRNVEVRISYGDNYSEFPLSMSMQVTNVFGKLNQEFDFIGLESKEFLKTEATIIKTIEHDKIPTKVQTIRTSEPITTFGIFLALPYEGNDKRNLSVQIDFYVDGKKTASKNSNLTPSNNRIIGYVLHVNKPTEIIETDAPH